MTIPNSRHPPDPHFGIGTKEENPKYFPVVHDAVAPGSGLLKSITVIKLVAFGARILIIIRPLRNNLQEAIVTSCLIPFRP